MKTTNNAKKIDKLERLKTGGTITPKNDLNSLEAKLRTKKTSKTADFVILGEIG